MRTSRSARLCLGLASALVLATSVVACFDDDEANDDLTNLAIEFGNARGEELAIVTDQELGPQPEDVSSAMAALIVLTIDEGEIATAQAALPNLVDPDVIEFANLMLAEHGRHLVQTQELIAELGMTPVDTAVAAALRIDAEVALGEIQTAGAATDVVYMRTQVELHSAAMKVADALTDNIEDDDEFEDFLEDFEDLVSDHRQDAIDVLRDL